MDDVLELVLELALESDCACTSVACIDELINWKALARSLSLNPVEDDELVELLDAEEELDDETALDSLS